MTLSRTSTVDYVHLLTVPTLPPFSFSTFNHLYFTLTARYQPCPSTCVFINIVSLLSVNITYTLSDAVALLCSALQPVPVSDVTLVTGHDMFSLVVLWCSSYSCVCFAPSGHFMHMSF